MKTRSVGIVGVGHMILIAYCSQGSLIVSNSFTIKTPIHTHVNAKCDRSAVREVAYRWLADIINSFL